MPILLQIAKPSQGPTRLVKQSATCSLYLMLPPSSTEQSQSEGSIEEVQDPLPQMLLPVLPSNILFLQHRLQ